MHVRTVGLGVLGALLIGSGAVAADRSLSPASAFRPAQRVLGPCGRSNPDAAPGPCGSSPVISGCQVLPPDNPWNTDISSYPVHPLSSTYIAQVDSTGNHQPGQLDGPNLWPGFGTQFGIPWITVGPGQPSVPISYFINPDESDPGPFPIPTNAPVESISDRHVIALQSGTCQTYELLGARLDGRGGWAAATGATFDLTSNRWRPNGNMSADDSGTSIFVGLLKAQEVLSGSVNHAVRFTVNRAQAGYILPARHQADSTDLRDPPFGQRFRIRADYDISWMTGEARVIAEALKRYGMILADEGPNWMIVGDQDPGWAGTNLPQIWQVPSSAFEAVYTGEISRCASPPCQ